MWIGRVDSSLEHAVYGLSLQRIPSESNAEEAKVLEEKTLDPLIGYTPCEGPQKYPWADSNRPTLSEAWALWKGRGATVNTGDAATDVKRFIWAPQKRVGNRAYVDGVANPHLVMLLRDVMRAQINENLAIHGTTFKRSPTTNAAKISGAWLLGARFQRDIRSSTTAGADIASVVYIGAETIHEYGQISAPE